MRKQRDKEQTLEEQRWESPKLFRRIVRVLTPQPSDLPNMPKFQSCPQCHARARRATKTMGGANYHCRKCQNTFFVRS